MLQQMPTTLQRTGKNTDDAVKTNAWLSRITNSIRLRTMLKTATNNANDAAAAANKLNRL